jgi:hypothetical protein
VDIGIKFTRKLKELKEKCSKCKGKLKTDLKHKINSKTDHSSIPKLAGMEVKVKLKNLKKKNYGRHVCSCTYSCQTFRLKGMTW